MAKSLISTYLAREELIERAGLSSGGGISRILKELEESNLSENIKLMVKNRRIVYTS